MNIISYRCPYPDAFLFSMFKKPVWSGSCLMDIFNVNLFQCYDKSFWNLPFKGTRHGMAYGGCCCCNVAMIVAGRVVIIASLSLNIYCEFTQCMIVTWILIAKIELPKGNKKQWCTPPKTIRHVRYSAWARTDTKQPYRAQPRLQPLIQFTSAAK